LELVRISMSSRSRYFTFPTSMLEINQPGGDVDDIARFEGDVFVGVAFFQDFADVDNEGLSLAANATGAGGRLCGCTGRV
jgi:hypothetical protein